MDYHGVLVGATILGLTLTLTLTTSSVTNAKLHQNQKQTDQITAKSTA